MIKRKLAARLAAALIRIWCLTIRISFDQRELKEELLSRNGPVLLIFWHRHLFYLLHFFRKSSFRPLISLSGDGELIALIAGRFGLNPIRGSSSRGGAVALLQILRLLKRERETILITADGPRGPLREVKPGILKIMEQEGLKVFPVSWYGSRVKVFEKSWDKFLLPLPFSRIRLRTGPELKANSVGFSSLEVNEALNNLENKCIKYFSQETRGEYQ